MDTASEDAAELTVSADRVMATQLGEYHKELRASKMQESNGAATGEMPPPEDTHTTLSDSPTSPLPRFHVPAVPPNAPLLPPSLLRAPSRQHNRRRHVTAASKGRARAPSMDDDDIDTATGRVYAECTPSTPSAFALAQPLFVSARVGSTHA